MLFMLAGCLTSLADCSAWSNASVGRHTKTPQTRFGDINFYSLGMSSLSEERQEWIFWRSFGCRVQTKTVHKKHEVEWSVDDLGRSPITIISETIRCHNTYYHCYADDAQVCMALIPGENWDDISFWKLYRSMTEFAFSCPQKLRLS